MTGPRETDTESGSPAPDFDTLRSTVRGAVLLPADPGYDDAASVWNGRYEGRPAVVVRAGGADDVVAAVDFARDADLTIGVKGGGHDYGGRSAMDGGVLIDLSAMAAVEVDPKAGTARVQAGATWGGFDLEAQRFGLATTGPTVSSVGVSGSTLGGGSGWLLRKHGLSLDNLLSAEMVTADGRVVRAAGDENPDLFWALRGGGGNFGVVTALEYRVHPVGPELLGGQIFHRFTDAGDVVRGFRDFMADAPDELMAYAFFLRVPPLEGFLEEHHGDVVLDLVVSWAGAVEEGEEALGPLRAMGDPLIDTVEPVAYRTLQQSFDEGLPGGQRYVSRGQYLDALDDDAIDTIITHAADLRGPFTMAYLEPIGGAAARPAVDATAFPHRDAAFSFHLLAGWSDPLEDDDVIGWARAFHEAVEPHGNGGVYVNLLDGGEGDRVRAAYGSNYDRLARIKAEWDPHNRFRFTANIRPNGAAR